MNQWHINHSTVAGAGAGLVTSIAGCPLDVIKTKLQAQQTAHGTLGYKGVSGTVKDILLKDGLKGLYRGLGPTILGYLPTWAIYFTVYDSIKEYFGSHALGGRHLDAHGHVPPSQNASLQLHVFSAMLAGGASTICTSPLWVIKTRFMTQHHTEVRYRHTLDAFRTIYKAEGVRAFYRGLLTSLLGTTHVAVQFPLYEYLRHLAEVHSEPQPLTSAAIIGCSALSKTIASVTTYPHEVIRTRLQIQKSFITPGPLPGINHPAPRYTGILQTAALIVHEEGLRGLYKGLSINLIRTVPNSAVTLLTYELIMRYLDDIDPRKHK